MTFTLGIGISLFFPLLGSQPDGVGIEFIRNQGWSIIYNYTSNGTTIEIEDQVGRWVPLRISANSSARLSGRPYYNVRMPNGKAYTLDCRPPSALDKKPYRFTNWQLRIYQIGRDKDGGTTIFRGYPDNWVIQFSEKLRSNLGAVASFDYSEDFWIHVGSVILETELARGLEQIGFGLPHEWSVKVWAPHLDLKNGKFSTHHPEISICYQMTPLSPEFSDLIRLMISKALRVEPRSVVFVPDLPQPAPLLPGGSLAKKFLDSGHQRIRFGSVLSEIEKTVNKRFGIRYRPYNVKARERFCSPSG